MSTVKELLEKAQEGFRLLDVPEKYKNSARKWMEIWLTDSVFSDYVPQISYLVEQKKWDFLLDSFYQVIPFGTGGRRGPVGIGPNRINKWTIQASAQGHSQYLIRRHGEAAKQRGVVLTFDVRKYEQKGVYNDALPNPVMGVDGKRLAIAAASVYAANGIKVFFFETVRSTPQLSFAIRHLNTISGDMFSASHNLPADNGKKVYDQHGGQLIPPDDQALVEEVANRVKEIKTMAFDEARAQGLIEIVGDSVDEAYRNAACSVSLSEARNIKVLYSPLHGTGLTSVHPVLRRLGFDVTLDPATSNLSGAFENVTFSIPNPEVEESFDTAFAPADEIGAELIINTDPDADRIGVMVKHDGSWKFLTGNEIGILLTQYGISKFRQHNRLRPDSLIIKTDVTTSLIRKIAGEHNVRCIGDLLVGFKYIGHEMNTLESRKQMDGFIIGTEESHGFLMGNYCRDKDASCAAVWICERAAELRKHGKTLLDDLNDIYARYGYCHNYLTEIRLLGARGIGQIKSIMEHLRQAEIASFGAFSVKEKRDRWQGEPQPHLSATDTSSRNVLTYYFDDIPETTGLRVTVRPSGTEPKIKMYFEVIGKPCRPEILEEEKSKTIAVRIQLEKAFMQYCYRLLEVDFPDRGFLLFWQLPLEDKMKYFRIEDEIVNLKNIDDPEKRKVKLESLLGFLGANPVEKVDNAFRKKYGEGIRRFLGLTEKKR